LWLIAVVCCCLLLRANTHQFTYRYADPDAEPHELFDVSAERHAAIIEERARGRRRQFRESILGSRRPSRSNRSSAPAPSNVDACEEEVVLQGDAGAVMLPPLLLLFLLLLLMLLLPDPVEWEDSHVHRREELVAHFQIAWDNGDAEWLSFPGTRHDGVRRNCN